MRNLSLDYMKVLLAFFIVFIHGGLFYDFDKELSYIFVNGVFRIAVPLFFIINGYYFTVSNTNQLKKWFKKVLILYVIWTIIYLPVMFYSFDVKRVMLYSLIGYFILWYLTALMFSGLLLYYVRHWKSSYILSSAFFLLLIGYVIQTLGRIDFFSGFLGSLFDFGPSHRNFIFFGFSFVAIGYIIRRDNFSIDRNKNIRLIFLFSMILLLEVLLNHYIVNPL
jgi:surface polysaccharide O-acyltransferase-like enzyme